VTTDLASPVVLVSFQGQPPAGLLDTLRAGGQLRESPPWVFSCGASPRAVAQTLLGLRADTDLHPSAAVLAELPPSDRLWVAYEWWGLLVVQAAFLGTLGDDHAGWEVHQHIEDGDLLVLRPREAPPEPDETSNQDDVPDPPAAVRLETPEEFLTAVDSDRPATTLALARDVQAEPQRWFGRLADPHVGGAIALVMTAPQHPADPSLLVLHSPGALGLKVGRPSAGLDRLAELHGLSVQAWGISELGHSAVTAALLEHEPRLDPAAVEKAVAGRAQLHGCGYAIIAVMHAPVDPTVHIPTGAVFEQTELRPQGDREQNVVLAAPARVPVPLGAFIPVILPAWCMNRSLAAPRGSALRATALSMTRAPATQEEVWQRIARATAERT
jgi:hypothetical protein